MRFSPVILAAMLLLSFAAKAETTNGLSEAEIKGRELARQLCDAQPAENFKQKGSLKIRAGKNDQITVPVNFEIWVKFKTDMPRFWASSYQASWSNKVETLSIHHSLNRTNEYYYTGPVVLRPELANVSTFEIVPKLSHTELTKSFAGSDFWFCDLGLEFFHWPTQKVLKKEIHRSCACTVLESTNPNPTTNDYSRVVSWIDTESLGIVEAYAYDFNGKKLKDFYPKDIKKVNGQWQVQTLVMENVQTGSRSRLEFDLKK